jgi:hypothetical protein
MKNITRFILILFLLLSLGVGILACKSETSELSEEDKVRVYSDPATETALQGLSENDLAKYIRYGNDDFKAAVTEEILDASAAQINSQLGVYKSKEFLSIEKQEGYTIVHYTAVYTKGETGIRMVFDEDQLIAGQWFEQL